MEKLFLLSIILFSVLNLKAQNSDSSAFDFWIGEWDLTWVDSEGKEKKGQNRIERVLNSKVIQENFNSLEEDESQRFVGKSWTVYIPQTNEWKQTWVDNSGAYLDFIAKIEGEKRYFSRSFKSKEGETIYQRMVFYNIVQDSFDWDWESSKDAENWDSLWKIKYSRLKP